CQTEMDDEALLASFRYAQRQDRLIGQLGHAAVALHEAETADERKAARVAAAKRRRELERAKIREERRQQRIAARRADAEPAIAAE
ncbi:hypothetical protein, partial [Inquilinus sp.]|uniref:hypothetical protein n=1 Tax=Inquilinus sp. TaxID=1932117 RepID=UPI0031CE0BA4